MKATTLKEQKVIFWSKHVDLATQYPDGNLKYCEANGLASQTFYKWQLRLQSQGVKKPPTKRSTKNPFAEVPVCEPEAVHQQGLPDAKWLAQLIFHLNEAAR